MKVLLDTNIVIHREAGNVVNPDIGILFKWLDDLHYQKCVHPVTVEEINKHKDPKTVATFNIKLGNYHQLKTKAPINHTVQQVCSKIDNDKNDLSDTTLLNELVNNRVDILISEDKQIFHKALLLGVCDRVFTIDSFLEKVTVENPKLQNYKVLSVKQEHFGNLNLADEFFSTLKQDYPGFDKWFNRKADEIAYVCKQDNKLLAFLYLKIERGTEDYSDIIPAFSKKKRLKIGTFKVDYNGFKLGERFLKIIFDNAIQAKTEEIYVTIFNKRLEQQRLIALLETYGFVFHGHKKSGSNEELVYVRNFSKKANRDVPKVTFPYISTKGSIFIVPIYPEYHTNLLPDSILKTELGLPPVPGGRRPPLVPGEGRGGGEQQGRGQQAGGGDGGRAGSGFHGRVPPLRGAGGIHPRTPEGEQGPCPRSLTGVAPIVPPAQRVGRPLPASPPGNLVTPRGRAPGRSPLAAPREVRRIRPGSRSPSPEAP